MYYLFSHSTNLQILAKKKLTKNQVSQKMYSVYSLKDADAVIQYLFKSGLLLISATLEQSKSSAGKAWKIFRENNFISWFHGITRVKIQNI